MAELYNAACSGDDGLEIIAVPTKRENPLEKTNTDRIPPLLESRL